MQLIELDDDQRARLERRCAEPSLYDRVKSLLRRRGFAVDSSEDLIESFRRIYYERERALRSLSAARRSHRVRRTLSALARAARSHGRADDRAENGHGGILGRRNTSRARSHIDSSRNSGRFARVSAKERTHERHGHRSPRLLPREVRAQFPDLAIVDLSRQPLDGRRAARRAIGARRLLERVGGGRPRSVGTLAAAHRARSPTASARSSARRPGSVFLGPNVSVLQAAIASCIDFSSERNEIVYESLQFPSLTYVWREWERYGAAVRIAESDDGRTVPTERIIEAITEKTAIAVISHAYYVSGAVADVGAIQAHCRSVGALLCVDAYQTTGIYPYDVVSLDLDLVTGGSHKWLCGGPGCGWIYVKPSLLDSFRPAITGWMAHARPFAFEAAPIVHAPSMYRFGHGTPTIPGYVVAAPGHAMIAALGVRANSRTQRPAHRRRSPAMALERGLRVNTPLEARRRHGLDRDRFRRFGAREPPLDRSAASSSITGPGCGIRIGPHFYTVRRGDRRLLPRARDRRGKPRDAGLRLR